MPELIYLACPYSSEFPIVKDGRYDIVTRVAAALVIETACEVFSPITHSHLINRYATEYAKRKNDKSLIDDEPIVHWRPTYDFWLTFDYHMLDIADWLYILKLQGWAGSTGVAKEITRFSQRRGMQNRIKHIKPEDYLKGYS